MYGTYHNPMLHVLHIYQHVLPKWPTVNVDKHSIQTAIYGIVILLLYKSFDGQMLIFHHC